MKSSRKTFAELQAWLDRWNENRAAPDAKTLTDFLGIELAPEPTLQTDGVSALCWQRYAGVGKTWFSNAEVADWDVVA